MPGLRTVQSILNELYGSQGLSVQSILNAVYNAGGFGGGSSPARYVALLTQAGVGATTATVLENSLGATLAFSYNDVGDYLITASAAVFTANKTRVQIHANNSDLNGSYGAAFVIVDTSHIHFTVNDQTFAGLDYWDGSIEITVYP